MHRRETEVTEGSVMHYISELTKLAVALAAAAAAAAAVAGAETVRKVTVAGSIGADDVRR